MREQVRIFYKLFDHKVYETVKHLSVFENHLLIDHQFANEVMLRGVLYFVEHSLMYFRVYF